ncbi:MAG: FAD-dependent oxidoreductase [Rhodopirellula sp.]|nr:FAD-dependent oxidoreductase [Rhodopirellula sp.]
MSVSCRYAAVLCLNAGVLVLSSAHGGEPAASAGRPAVVLVEAEGFQNLGGWVVDQQAMDQMGSPFLLAHGLGTPVDDAVTTVRIPDAGKYRVWVRTRDWIAPWNGSPGPGRFRVLVDGKALSATFGTVGESWHWQDGGVVEIRGPNVRLALDDLTGFDGRCDAIVLAADPHFVPPHDLAEMDAFRRERLGLPASPSDAGQFDLVVTGGGIAGACAAISAARLGLQVALIQDRPVLGGNNSSEVRVGLSGHIGQEPYPALGDVVAEIGPVGYWDLWAAKKYPDRPESRRVLEIMEKNPEKKTHNAGPPSNYRDDKKLAIVAAEPNIHLFLNTHATAVEMQGDRITAVVARNIRDSREWRFPGRLFADCTGDGTIGFLSGAYYRVGRESREETGESLAPEEADRMVMGTSVQWYAVEENQAVEFPDCPWALAFTEETCQRMTRGDWDWETGLNQDQITQFELIRDHALRVVYGNWSFLKNHAADKAKYAPWRLTWVAYVGGKRESRRLLGDVVLQQQDIESGRKWPDACVTCTWGIDLHYPSPENSEHFPGHEFRSIARSKKIEPYAIPYRCLYSQNIANLMMAGRNISVTHVALGTVRVQKTTGMMGEVVGMAASLAAKQKTTPRGVYENHLAQLKQLMERGVGKKPPSTASTESRP